LVIIAFIVFMSVGMNYKSINIPAQYKKKLPAFADSF